MSDMVGARLGPAYQFTRDGALQHATDVFVLKTSVVMFLGFGRAVRKAVEFVFLAPGLGVDALLGGEV